MSSNFSAGNDKMYLFLSKLGDWQKRIDQHYGNNDGNILKSEFKNCIRAEYNTQMGTSYGSADLDTLVDNFFKSNDTNNNYNKVSGTNLINYNLLDSDEIQAINETHMVQYEIIQDVLNGFINGSLEGVNFPFPNQLGSDFINELNAILSNALAISNSIGEEALTQDLINAINTYAPTIAADCYEEILIKEFTNTLKKNAETSGYNFNLASYEDLENLIASAVRELLENGEITNLGTISSVIKEVIKNYINISLTDINSLSETDKEKELTEMTKDKLKKDLNDIIKGLLINNPVYHEFKNEMNTDIEAYINTLLNNAQTFGDIESIIEEVQAFKNSNIYKTYEDQLNGLTPDDTVTSQPVTPGLPNLPENSINPDVDQNTENFTLEYYNFSYEDLFSDRNGVSWLNNSADNFTYRLGSANRYFNKQCSDVTFKELYDNNSIINIEDNTHYNNLVIAIWAAIATKLQKLGIDKEILDQLFTKSKQAAETMYNEAQDKTCVRFADLVNIIFASIGINCSESTNNSNVVDRNNSQAGNTDNNSGNGSESSSNSNVVDRNNGQAGNTDNNSGNGSESSSNSNVVDRNNGQAGNTDNNSGNGSEGSSNSNVVDRNNGYNGSSDSTTLKNMNLSYNNLFDDRTPISWQYNSASNFSYRLRNANGFQNISCSEISFKELYDTNSIVNINNDSHFNNLIVTIWAAIKTKLESLGVDDSMFSQLYTKSKQAAEIMYNESQDKTCIRFADLVDTMLEAVGITL